MKKNEDPGLPKPRLFNKSIETLCQPPPLEKYTEAASDSYSPPPYKTKRLFPWSTLFTKSFLFLVLATLLLGGFFKFAWPLIKPTHSHSFVSLRGPCPDFVGREDYLNVLYKELINKWEPATVRVQGLWGKGGFGKSELAIEFANRFRDSFSSIWTFYCDSEESLKQGYQELAKQVGVFNPSDSVTKTQEKVHFYLENENLKKPWLLIFDNVEDSLPEYPQRGGAVLFTTQKKIFNPQFLLELTPFTKEESIELLETITGEERSSSMEELANDLECIPLLMNYAAHYIKATPGCTTADYQNLFCHHLFERAGPLWKEMDVNRRYLKSLASSWQFSLKALEKENPSALAWLYVCSYLYPENIPETWIDDWLSSKEKNSGQTIEIQRKAILQTLQNYGIIHFQEESRTFSLHRFFLYMIRESRQSNIPEDLAAVFNLLNKHTHDYNFFQSLSWEAGRTWHMHACEFTKWMDQYPQCFSDPVSLNNKASLFTALGLWNIFNYNFSRAIEEFQQALVVHQVMNNELSPKSAFNCACIGFSHFQLGHLREGLSILQKVEEVHRSSVHDRPLEFSSFLDVKGMCHYELQEYEEAVRCFQEALQINRHQKGDQHIEGLFTFDTMTSCLLGNLGRCLRDMKRYEEALIYFDQAIPLVIKTCGKGHPYYVLYTAEKADLVIKMGAPKKALLSIQEALREYSALNGSEFGEQALVWYVMGLAHFHLKNFKKAQEMFRKTRDFSVQYFGNESFMLLRAYHGMSLVYLKKKNSKKGLKYLRKWLAMCVKYGIRSEQMVLIFEEFQQALKEILQVKGNMLHAQKASQEAALLSEKILGYDHALTSYFRESSL